MNKIIIETTNRKNKTPRTKKNPAIYFKNIDCDVDIDVMTNPKVSYLYNPDGVIDQHSKFTKTSSPIPHIYELYENQKEILESDRFKKFANDSFNNNSKKFQIDFMMQEIMMAADTVYRNGFYNVFSPYAEYPSLSIELSSLFNILDQDLLEMEIRDYLFSYEIEEKEQMVRTAVNIQRLKLFALTLIANTYYDIIGGLVFGRALPIKTSAKKFSLAESHYTYIKFHLSNFINDITEKPDDMNIYTLANSILLDYATRDIKEIGDILNIILFKAMACSDDILIDKDKLNSGLNE